MDTIQLITEISVLKKKMDKAEAFLEELVEYLLVTCKDDDYITPEVICRKLAKYGYIELENGYWVNPLADRKTENSSEIPNNCEPKICDTCRYYNSNIPCGSTPSACKEADKFAKEFVDGLKKLKPKDEPQTCSVTGRPYSECGSCEHFKCTADEPQTERSE